VFHILDLEIFVYRTTCYNTFEFHHCTYCNSNLWYIDVAYQMQPLKLHMRSKKWKRTLLDCTL